MTESISRPRPIHTASGNYQPSAKNQSIATNRAVTFEDEWLQEGGKERERIRPDMKEESMLGCCFIFSRGAADWKQGRISGGWLRGGGGGGLAQGWKFLGLGCATVWNPKDSPPRKFGTNYKIELNGKISKLFFFSIQSHPQVEKKKTFDFSYKSFFYTFLLTFSSEVKDFCFYLTRRSTRCNKFFKLCCVIFGHFEKKQ